MASLVPAHGGKLLPLLIQSDKQLKEGLEEAKTLPKVRLNSKEVSDLIMLAMGAFSPLKGFMGKEDYESVVKKMCFKNSLLWPVPITLSVSKEDVNRFKEGEKIALLDSERDEIMASMIL